MAYRVVPKITDWQRQVIVGTLLGGSSLVKPRNGNNCYLSMRGRNGKWLQCKAQEIGFSAPNSFHLEDKYCRWHSVCSPIFNEFYDQFYNNGRKVVRFDILDSLRAIALTVMFLDVGLMRCGRIRLNFRSFGPDGAKTVLEYFATLDLNGTVTGSKIELDDNSTKKFIVVVGEHIPEFMLA